MTESAAGAWGHEASNGAGHGCAARKGKWKGWEIGAIVAGFVVFWPVGLAALGFKLVRGEIWPGSAQGVKPWEAFKSESFKGASKGWGFSSGYAGHSGNSAFEDYKKRELERLDNERRKLMEEQKAFREFVEHVRQAKDREEFDRFMAKRNAPPPPADETQS